MEGVETPSAASAVAVITALLWTLMKGTALVSNSALSRLLYSNEATTVRFIITSVGGVSLAKKKRSQKPVCPAALFSLFHFSVTIRNTIDIANEIHLALK